MRKNNFLQKNSFNLFLTYLSDCFHKVFDFDFISMERVDRVRWSLQVGTLFERSGAKTIASEPGKINPIDPPVPTIVFVIDLTRRSAAYAFVMCPQKEKNKRKTTHHFAGVRHVVRVQVLDEHVERSFAFFRKRGRVERGFLAVYHCEHNNNRNTSMEKTFAGSRI